MTTQTEALKLALEALEIGWSPKYVNGVDAREKGMKAITAIKEALANHIEDNLAMVAEPEQEPSYWLGFGLQAHTEKPFEGATPVWTKPQQHKEPEQKPVAWMYPDALCDKACLYLCTKGFTQFPECATLPQRTWVGLTDEQIEMIWRGGIYSEGLLYEFTLFARAIEAKLKEKNT